MRTRSLLSTLAILGLALSMTACVEADNNITISGLHVGEGAASTEMAPLCEWNPADDDSLVLQRTIVDLQALKDLGHAPFFPGTHPSGTLVGVVGVGNALTGARPSSDLATNQNGVYLKQFSIDWTIDGESKYKPGKASPGSPCSGNGLRLASDFLPTAVSSKPVMVELLTDKIPTAPGVDEINCLLGALEKITGDTSIPTEFIVEIQVLGETEAGVNVESPILRVPIVVCEGCSEQFSGVLSFNGNKTGATPMCRVTGN